MMKKFLASVFAAALFVASNVCAEPVPVPVPVIESMGADGSPGSAVYLKVAVASGDITGGGLFTVVYDATKLSFNGIVGGNGFLSVVFEEPFEPGRIFSLTQEADDPRSGPIGPIFTISFLINPNYVFSNPFTPNVDVTDVAISGEVQDRYSVSVEFETILAPVTVNAPAATVPEPGALALVGLALVIMVGTARRRRVSRP